MKTCSRCKEARPIEQFFRNKKSSDGRLGICTTCTAARLKEERAKNPLKYQNAILKNQHGISAVDYQRLFRKQKGVCVLCRKRPEVRPLDVDHCHATGRVRGLLCRKCNLGLGCFDDNLSALFAAVMYVTNKGLVSGERLFSKKVNK